MCNGLYVYIYIYIYIYITIISLIVILVLDLEPGDSHLLIACDGLWDVMSDQEAVDLMVFFFLIPPLGIFFLLFPSFCAPLSYPLFIYLFIFFLFFLKLKLIKAKGGRAGSMSRSRFVIIFINLVEQAITGDIDSKLAANEVCL